MSATPHIIEQRAYIAPGYPRDPGLKEFAVYEGDRLVRTCPSRGMAEEVAAGL